MRLAIALILSLLASPALAGEWFLHKFGELRAYHGPWLNVCADNGRGACRTVQYERSGRAETFFGESVVTVHRLPEGGHAIAIFARDLRADAMDQLEIVIDGELTTVAKNLLKRGTLDSDNVIDTVTITDTNLTEKLVQKMKDGRWMITRFKPTDFEGQIGDGEMRTSLRGITAALTAIERHLQTRGS